MRTETILLIAVTSLALAVPRVAYPGQDVVISEFMAVNESMLTNDVGDCSDWIEVHNVSTDGSAWRRTPDHAPWSAPTAATFHLR